MFYIFNNGFFVDIKWYIKFYGLLVIIMYI